MARANDLVVFGRVGRLVRERLLEHRFVTEPREALRGDITVPFLEPLCHSWSHFVDKVAWKLT